jgi:hypothetical protein
MAISEKVSSELLALQAQVLESAPLLEAPFSTVKAIQLNAANLVVDVQAELVSPTLLDTWAPLLDPVSLINGYLTVVTAGDDQNALSLMRGIVGRASSNLDQLV